ncbi:MAG: hypothetical protein DME92_11905 [Verrucomicrobia bacterium]|nr:MAG: hypothetical protein DME92_11905 [Verrucomicrobiota bacterium]
MHTHWSPPKVFSLPPRQTSIRCQTSKASSVTGCTRLRQGYGVAGMAIDRVTNEVLDKQIEVVNE